MCASTRTYEFVADTPTPGCRCLHHYRPEEYPRCICTEKGAFVCSVCGDVVHPMLMKSCAVCHKGINEGVSYTQHAHDDCFRKNQWG